MVPTHGPQNLATVAALAARVSAGGAKGAEGSFVFCLQTFAMCACAWLRKRAIVAGATFGVWAAGVRPFRMLQCPVAAGSLSYGTGAAVCALLRV
jgi:hypothetical protein